MADHDQLFKELLRTFFRDFLALVAPEVSSAAIHFLQPKLYADWPRGAAREVDLLARVGEAKDLTFLLHTEVESRFNAEATRRLERYFHLLKARYDEPVLPILVNLRGGAAGVRRLTRRERIGRSSQVFSYISFGLGGCQAEDYLARPEPLAWGLAALMRPGPGGRARQKLACLSRIARGQISTLQAFALVNCVETYIQLNPEEAAELDRLWLLEGNEEARAMELTWADRMRAEGIQIGMEKGLEMTRQVLAKILQQRFGELPPTSRRRLAAIRSLDRLNRLAEQVLTARSLAELGLA
jgi:hypothetical protein